MVCAAIEESSMNSLGVKIGGGNISLSWYFHHVLYNVWVEFSPKFFLCSLLYGCHVKLKLLRYEIYEKSWHYTFVLIYLYIVNLISDDCVKRRFINAAIKFWTNIFRGVWNTSWRIFKIKIYDSFTLYWNLIFWARIFLFLFFIFFVCAISLALDICFAYFPRVISFDMKNIN